MKKTANPFQGKLTTSAFGVPGKNSEQVTATIAELAAGMNIRLKQEPTHVWVTLQGDHQSVAKAKRHLLPVAA